MRDFGAYHTLHIIPAAGDGPRLHRIVQMGEPPSFDRLHQAVGGPIKVIEGFDSILRDGELEPCLAFCNILGEAFELPQNSWANLLWLQAMVRAHGFAEAKIPKSLRGPVAVLWGDNLWGHPEFLEEVALRF